MWGYGGGGVFGVKGLEWFCMVEGLLTGGLVVF